MLEKEKTDCRFVVEGDEIKEASESKVPMVIDDGVAARSQRGLDDMADCKDGRDIDKSSGRDDVRTSAAPGEDAEADALSRREARGRIAKAAAALCGIFVIAGLTTAVQRNIDQKSSGEPISELTGMAGVSVFSAFTGDRDVAQAIPVLGEMAGGYISTDKARERRRQALIASIMSGSDARQRPLSTLTAIGVDWRRGSEAQALEGARQMVELYPQNSSLSLILAVSLANTGDFAAAIDQAVKALELKQHTQRHEFPPFSEAQISRIIAELCIGAGDPQKALPYLSNLGKDADDFDKQAAKREMGNCYVDLKQFDKAREIAESSALPESDRHLLMARIFNGQGDYDSALRELAKVPDSGLLDGVTITRAKILERTGKSEEALTLLDSYLKGHSYRCDVLLERAKLLNKLGQYKRAFLDADLCLDMPTRWFLLPHIYAARAEALSHLGRASEALDDAKLSLKGDPHQKEAVGTALSASRQLKDQAQIDYYDKMIKSLAND